MADRAPVWDLHIRPMFRLLDRDHMVWAFDLWSYDDVVAHAPTILTRLRADMPPKASGGPWPAEWVGTFERWTMTGFSRLQKGRATNALLQQAGDLYTLTCDAEVPTSSSVAWLELVNAAPANRTYELVVLVTGNPGAPSTTPVFEEFTSAAALTGVVVIDAVGTSKVPVTS